MQPFTISDTYLPGGAPLDTTQQAGIGGGILGFLGNLLAPSVTSAVQSVLPGGGGSAISPGMSSGGGSFGGLMLGPDGRLYRRAGRPLLWSGDVSAMKRLRKVNKLMHHLFPSHHTRARRRVR